MPSKARDIVEKHFGRRPSAHPQTNLQDQAKRMKAIAAAAVRRCHDAEKWDARLEMAEIILREMASPRNGPRR